MNLFVTVISVLELFDLRHTSHESAVVTTNVTNVKTVVCQCSVTTPVTLKKGLQPQQVTMLQLSPYSVMKRLRSGYNFGCLF